MKRLLRASLLCLFLWTPGVTHSGAQTISLSLDETPLAEALRTFSEQTGADVVFSSTLIADRTTSCTYRGDSRQAALLCIVAGHPFRIQSVSRSQFVLVPRPEESDPTDTRQVVLSGFVQDASTNELLIGAHVLLPDLSIGAVTNDAGYFALPGVPTGRHRLRASFIGFAPVDTLVTISRDRVDLSLTPVTQSTDGVTIESTADPMPDAGISPGVVSVPVQRLGELPASLGGQDVFEELRWMPGIQRTGEATGGLVIRGSGTDQNLYLIDGAPIYHPWHAFSLISTFQTETFKDVDLYRGAFPAEYGGRLSAVLDAELRDGGRSSPRMLASVSALNARFLMESPISRHTSFMLSGRRSYVDKLIGRQHAVSDEFGRRDTLRTGYFFYDWSAKVTYRSSPRASLSVSYYNGRDVLDLRLPFDLSLDFSSWLRPADLFFEVDQNWGNRVFSIRHQYLASDKLFMTTTAYDTRYSADEGAFVRPTNTASVRSDYAVDLNDLGVGVDFDYYASLAHHLRFGAQVVRHRYASDIDATVTYAPTITEQLDESSSVETVSLAAYVQDRWRPSSRLHLLPGVRVSYFQNGSYLRVSPRFSAQYDLVPGHLALRAAATSQVQYTQRIRDRFSFLYDLVSSRWIPAADDTPPSRSHQYTAGLEWRPSGAFKMTVDGYTRNGRDILLPRDEFQSKDGLLGPGIEIGTLLGQYTSGEERSSGVEFGLDVEQDPYRAVISLTVSDSRSRTTSLDDRTFRPTRFDAPVSGSLVAQRTRGNWLTGVSTVWRSGYPISQPTARYTLRDPVTGEEETYFHRPSVNNGRLPAYFRVDLHAAYRFNFADASWTAGLNLYNVLNRRNVVDRVFDPEQKPFRPEDRLGLPILPLFELQMSL